MRWMLLTASLLLFSAAFAAFAQVRTGGVPPQNLQFLKPSEVQSQMAAYNRALGVGCEYCHMPADFATDDNRNKVVTREMIKLTRDLNSRYFGGGEAITCFTCHGGSQLPLTDRPANQ